MLLSCVVVAGALKWSRLKEKEDENKNENENEKEKEKKKRKEKKMKKDLTALQDTAASNYMPTL